jgi:hypothetical protein
MSELKLPEDVRKDLAQLHQIAQQAQRELNIAVGIAYKFLGLDPKLDHRVDLDSGVVTPAELTDETTPVRENGKVKGKVPA